MLIAQENGFHVTSSRYTCRPVPYVMHTHLTQDPQSPAAMCEVPVATEYHNSYPRPYLLLSDCHHSMLYSVFCITCTVGMQRLCLRQ